MEPVRLEDAFGRGAYGSKRVVVNRETLPDRRSGREPAKAHPTEAAPRRTYTYDKDGQLVST
jgi:hypothetical protein